MFKHTRGRSPGIPHAIARESAPQKNGFANGIPDIYRRC
jgi:hypothetical protein